MEYISKIIGPIYVGSWEGAKDFKGGVLFVHHDIQWYTKGLHIPLLSKRPNSATDRSGAKVNLGNLELIMEVIETHFQTDNPLLIHCKGGVERSPLSVASWLVKYHNWTLDRAYFNLKQLRPVVEDRREWLNGD
jgi:Dual specificity phosphatase, catalytic domain